MICQVSNQFVLTQIANSSANTIRGLFETVMETVFNQSIWGDEGFSAILSMKSIPQILAIISRDTSPPLFNITQHLAFQLFGTSEVVIRGLVFGYFLLACVFVFLIANHVWGKKTALFAFFLTFLNPFFFTYAFEGRMYSIMALGVAASMYFFISKKWVGYVVATLWALYSHHFAIFVLAVQGLWFLKDFFTGERKVAIKMLKAFLFIGLGYIPWLIPLYNQTRMVGGGFWLGTPTPTDLRNLVYEYLAEGIKHPLAEPTLYVVFVGLLIRDWTKSIEKTIFFALWFIVPIGLTWLVSQQFQSIFFNRYLLYTIPGAMLVLASSRRAPASNIVLILVIVLFAIIDANYFTHPTKRPFKQLAAYVKETQVEGDFLINWNSSAHHLWETKYYDIPAPIYIPQDGDLPYYVGTALMTDEDIIKTLPDAQRVGIVTSGPVEEVKIAGYTKDEEEHFGELKFLWFDKDPNQ